VYKNYFWVSYCKPWFLWPETKKLVILFLRIYLFASLLSMHCVSPHWRSHKHRRISTLKPNIIFCDYLLDHNLLLRMGHQLKEDRKSVLTLKISSIFPKENISGAYLIFITSLPEDEQTSKHGRGGRYDAILEFKGSK
jgi:hypothetical protein